MDRCFYNGTQKFSVKRASDTVCSDEAVVHFKDRPEIQTFFDKAVQSRISLSVIQQIAKDIAPTFCRPHINSRPQLTTQERMDHLFSELDKGKVRVVLKNEALKPAQKKSPSPKEKNEKGFLERIDFKSFIDKEVMHLKKIFSKMMHANYSIILKEYHFDKNSTEYAPYVIDTNSVKTHSTGWTSWDDPFEIAVFGAFKNLAVYQISEFIKLSNTGRIAAGIGANTELISAQYLATGKSIICKAWYGSYAIRFNLKTCSLEIPWIRFDGCGAEERMLVELKRKDRIQYFKQPFYTTSGEIFIPPFSSMDTFITN